MRSPRYTIVVANRESGVVRRFTIRLAPTVTVVALAFALPVLVGMGIACVALMLALAVVKGRLATSTTVLLAGLACGPVFPTMMAVVLLSVQPDTMGRAVGFFFSFASVGWTVIPMIIGVVARKTDIQRGFLVAAGSGAVFLTLIVIRGMMIG